MAEWPKSAIRWIRRTLAGRETVQDGNGSMIHPPVISSGAAAVLGLESLVCSHLWRQTARGGFDTPDRDSSDVTNAFGFPVTARHSDSARAVIASAAGAAMTGSRAAAFLPGDRLAEVHDQLFAAAGRRLPLVIHAACKAMPRQSRAFGSGHEGYHSIAATGVFLCLARNAQHALDLTLVARRLAELSLTPGVVAMDGPETAGAAQEVSLPTPERVVTFLGRADSGMQTPTDAQRMLFGQTRHALPNWFDLDRPAAFGTMQAGDDYGFGAAGRRAFFESAVPGLLKRALDEYAGLTNRIVGPVFEHALDGAQHVVVTQGSAVELAAAVADHLNGRGKPRVGVLSIDWLRPFPTNAVKAALAQAKVVTVLERADDPLGQSPPLLGDIAAALQGGPTLLSGIFGVGGQAVTAAHIVAVFENMAQDQPKRRFVVGMGGGDRHSAFPKRQVLLDGVHRAYPELEDNLLPPAAPVDLRPEGAITVSVHCLPGTVPESGPEPAAEPLAEAVGEHVRSRSRVVAHRVWAGLVTAAPVPLFDPGDDIPVDIAFVASLDLPPYINPLERVVEGGSVVFGLGLAADELWDRLPRTWQALIEQRRLQAFATALSLNQIGDDLTALATGHEHGFELVALGSPSAPLGGEPELPLLIRRITRNDTDYDNPSRFWGEVVQPRMMGEAPQATPDPYLAVGAVPASTATFRDATLSRTELPKVDPDLCTGCGKCWTACPDSSLGPVAISPQGLLDGASRLADTAGPVADKVRRSHKNLAARVAKIAAASGAGSVSQLMWREAWAWLVGRGAFREDERAEADTAFEATLAQLEAMPIAITEPFFAAAEAAKSGTGELFLLGVNPQTCQGCTSCVVNCPDDAIRMVPQSGDVLPSAREGWRLFESLPDTPGQTIARVRERLGLAAVLLSRHCHLAVAGGSASEPGSGARLATRLVAGAIEYSSQQRMLALGERLGGAVQDLKSAIQAGLSGALNVDDLGSLSDALGQLGGRRAPLAQLAESLEAQGDSTVVDTANLDRCTRLAADLEQLQHRLSRGPNGIGRARMGLVVTSGEVGEWAARFPHNPFYAPLTVDFGGDGAELAIGVQHGLLRQYLDLYRQLRLAKVVAEAPNDRAAQEQAIAGLVLDDLTDDEVASLPPLVLLADAEGLGTSGLSGLSEILTSELPIRVLLLDRRAQIGTHVDPTLFALSHRTAFVVSGSIAYPDHLFDGVVKALSYRGPALIHVIAPSPGRDGFGTGRARDRAREAVTSRVHPLLTYDPGLGGVFGARMDISANPESAAPWVLDSDGRAVTPAHWAGGHERSAGLLVEANGAPSAPLEEHLQGLPDDRPSDPPSVLLPDGRTVLLSDGALAQVEDRLANWTTLQELAGVVTPFTQQVRARAESDLADDHGAALAALEAEYRAKIADVEAASKARQVAQLRQRLMQLAGFGSTTPGNGGSA